MQDGDGKPFSELKVLMGLPRKAQLQMFTKIQYSRVTPKQVSSPGNCPQSHDPGAHMVLEMHYYTASS